MGMRNIRRRDIMRNGFRVFLTAIVALVVQFGMLGPNARAMDERQTIAPDSHIQDQIKYIVTLETPEEGLREISKLKKMGSVEHLIQQLIYFQVNQMRLYRTKKITSRDLEKTSWGAHGTIALLLDWDKNTERITSASAYTLINAVLPYLGTKDPDLRSKLHEVLLWVDKMKGLRKNYTEYESYIASKKDNPPIALIRYMYQEAPREALLSLMRIYMKEPEKRKPIIQSEKVISSNIRKRLYKNDPDYFKIRQETLKNLSYLSQYNQWWVRLYVAEAMDREP